MQNSNATPDERRNLIVSFFDTLLPRVDGRHRNMPNEERYVLTTVRRLFLRHLDLRLEEEEIRRVLFDMGYPYFSRTSVWLPLYGAFATVDGKSSDADGTSRLIEGNPSGERLHWGVDGNAVRLLRSTLIPCPENTAQEKRVAVEEMHRRVCAFMERYGNT